MGTASPEARPAKLTARQLRFAEEYAASGNRVQSYHIAYGRSYLNRKGKLVPRSYKAAANSAAKLLENPGIKAEVDEILRCQSRRTKVTSDRWVRALSAIAFSDVLDLYESDPENGGLPRPKPWDRIPPALRQTVQSVKVKRRKLKGSGDVAIETEEVEYRPADKLRALELLGKHFGYLKERTPLDQLLNLIPPSSAEVFRRAINEASVN